MRFKQVQGFRGYWHFKCSEQYTLKQKQEAKIYGQVQKLQDYQRQCSMGNNMLGVGPVRILQCHGRVKNA